MDCKDCILSILFSPSIARLKRIWKNIRQRLTQHIFAPNHTLVVVEPLTWVFVTQTAIGDNRLPNVCNTCNRHFQWLEIGFTLRRCPKVSKLIWFTRHYVILKYFILIFHCFKLMSAPTFQVQEISVYGLLILSYCSFLKCIAKVYLNSPNHKILVRTSATEQFGINILNQFKFVKSRPPVRRSPLPAQAHLTLHKVQVDIRGRVACGLLADYVWHGNTTCSCSLTHVIYDKIRILLTVKHGIKLHL